MQPTRKPLRASIRVAGETREAVYRIDATKKLFDRPRFKIVSVADRVAETVNVSYYDEDRKAVIIKDVWVIIKGQPDEIEARMATECALTQIYAQEIREILEERGNKPTYIAYSCMNLKTTEMRDSTYYTVLLHLLPKLLSNLYDIPMDDIILLSTPYEVL